MITEEAVSELRDTGISVVGDVPWGTHFCYFYETKPDLLETLVQYFKTGLECKEFCVWVVSPPLTVEEARHALAQAVPDLDRHLAEGALEIHGNHEWYLPSGRWDSQRVLQSWREKLNRTSMNGYTGLRAAGDGGWVRSDDWIGFREYEQQVNALIADQRGIILCTYPLATSPGDQVFDVACIHQVAVARRNGSWEMVETPQVKEAKAEIKRLNAELQWKVEERTRELAATNEALNRQIIERKKLEEHARVLIDAIPHQIWSGPADGTLDYCNARWRSYMGIGLKDLQGDGWQTMLHPHDRERVLKAWRDSVANGKLYHQEERHRGADGKYRWFLSLAVPLRDAEGRIVRWYGTNTDIEERKEAEGALRKSEKLFAAFMDHLPGFAWMKDIEGRYVFVNKKESELDVYRDGAIGKTDAELWPEEIASAYRTNDQQVVITRKEVQAVEPSLAHGERSYMLVTKFPIFDQNGSVVMVAGAGVDITDLTQAKDALTAQALRYKTLMETSTDSIYVVDEKGDLREANAAFLGRRGYTAAEVKGLNVADWDAQWKPEKLRERLRGLRESSAVFETRHRCRDGSLFDVEVCATGVRIAGEQLFFCVTRDITERKQAEDRLRRSEEKFKTLFGIAPVGISVLDRQHNVIDANPALEQITRLRREELLNGTHRRRTILHADGTPMLSHDLPSARAIAENRPVNDVQLGIVMENGETVWLQVSAAPLSLPDGSAVVITQDITERKRAAEALKAANHQLRILSRQLFHIQEEERRHLARELHDEIGQTLTAAKINLKIIAPDVPAKITGRLGDSIQLLDQLLRQVRELSLDLRPPLLDELGLVPTLRWLVDQQAQRAGLRVNFTANVNGLELDPDVQTTCFRIAQEAITNIIRHSGAKSVAVELRRAAERLTLSVRDDGSGFDPATIQQRESQDFTLGLVSMKERALLVRGGFEVHSAAGQGTEIRAWFPLTFEKRPSAAELL
ncbi:MAG: hypothetical protein QOF24_478 [Verrucomicrobiota bacterium]|jgi:PAS domain S-box-containing protein